MTRDSTILPGQRLRARGAESNATGRFEATAREARRMDAEIERLREIPNTFKALGAAH